jgi:hypothetical protein
VGHGHVTRVSGTEKKVTAKRTYRACCSSPFIFKDSFVSCIWTMRDFHSPCTVLDEERSANINSAESGHRLALLHFGPMSRRHLSHAVAVDRHATTKPAPLSSGRLSSRQYSELNNEHRHGYADHAGCWIL